VTTLIATAIVTAPMALADLPGSWQTRAPAPVKRAEIAFVELNGKLHLLGDIRAHHVYDPATNTWSTKKRMPVAVDHVQGVTVGGKIYFIGGLASWPSPHVSTVRIYDPASNSWSLGASMGTRGRGAGGVAVHQGKIYYAGGLHDGVAVKWFDVYDPAANTWTVLPDMPRVREHFHAAGQADRKAYGDAPRRPPSRHARGHDRRREVHRHGQWRDSPPCGVVAPAIHQDLALDPGQRPDRIGVLRRGRRRAGDEEEDEDPRGRHGPKVGADW
jgi:hypothetical protein